MYVLEGNEMHSALFGTCGHNAVVLAAVAVVCLATPVLAAEVMPFAQQNTLVGKYCAVCHTDAAKNGGLSLEHFDAAQAPPSLTAMLLSKLTGGVLLKTAREAPVNITVAAYLDKKVASGAINAAGIPLPDKATIAALVQAFAIESAGATEWMVERSKHAVAGTPIVTASILQEVPSTSKPDEAE